MSSCSRRSASPYLPSAAGCSSSAFRGNNGRTACLPPDASLMHAELVWMLSHAPHDPPAGNLKSQHRTLEMGRRTSSSRSVKAATARLCISSTCSRNSATHSRSSSAGLLARPCAEQHHVLVHSSTCTQLRQWEEKTQSFAHCPVHATRSTRSCLSDKTCLGIALQAGPPGRPGGVGVLDGLAQQRAEGRHRIRVRRAPPPLVRLLRLAPRALPRCRLPLLPLPPLRLSRLPARGPSRLTPSPITAQLKQS